MADRDAYPMHAQELDKENKSLKARVDENDRLKELVVQMGRRLEALEKQVLGGRGQGP